MTFFIQAVVRFHILFKHRPTCSPAIFFSPGNNSNMTLHFSTEIFKSWPDVRTIFIVFRRFFRRCSFMTFIFFIMNNGQNRLTTKRKYSKKVPLCGNQKPIEKIPKWKLIQTIRLELQLHQLQSLFYCVGINSFLSNFILSSFNMFRKCIWNWVNQQFGLTKWSHLLRSIWQKVTLKKALS